MDDDTARHGLPRVGLFSPEIENVSDVLEQLVKHVASVAQRLDSPDRLVDGAAMVDRGHCIPQAAVWRFGGGQNAVVEVAASGAASVARVATLCNVAVFLVPRNRGRDPDTFRRRVAPALAMRLSPNGCSSLSSSRPLRIVAAVIERTAGGRWGRVEVLSASSDPVTVAFFLDSLGVLSPDVPDMSAMRDLFMAALVSPEKPPAHHVISDTKLALKAIHDAVAQVTGPRIAALKRAVGAPLRAVVCARTRRNTTVIVEVVSGVLRPSKADNGVVLAHMLGAPMFVLSLHDATAFFEVHKNPLVDGLERTLGPSLEACYPGQRVLVQLHNAPPGDHANAIRSGDVLGQWDHSDADHVATSSSSSVATATMSATSAPVSPLDHCPLTSSALAPAVFTLIRVKRSFWVEVDANRGGSSSAGAEVMLQGPCGQPVAVTAVAMSDAMVEGAFTSPVEQQCLQEAPPIADGHNGGQWLLLLPQRGSVLRFATDDFIGRHVGLIGSGRFGRVSAAVVVAAWCGGRWPRCFRATPPGAALSSVRIPRTLEPRYAAAARRYLELQLPLQRLVAAGLEAVDGGRGNSALYVSLDALVAAELLMPCVSATRPEGYTRPVKTAQALPVKSRASAMSSLLSPPVDTAAAAAAPGHEGEAVRQLLVRLATRRLPPAPVMPWDSPHFPLATLSKVASPVGTLDPVRLAPVAAAVAQSGMGCISAMSVEVASNFAATVFESALDQRQWHTARRLLFGPLHFNAFMDETSCLALQRSALPADRKRLLMRHVCAAMRATDPKIGLYRSTVVHADKQLRFRSLWDTPLMEVFQPLSASQHLDDIVRAWISVVGMMLLRRTKLTSCAVVLRIALFARPIR